MDHRCACPKRARHRVLTVSSGDGGTVELWGSVVRNGTVAGRYADRAGREGTDDLGQRGRQGAHANHAAALPARRFVVVLSGARRIHTGRRARIMIIRRRDHRRMTVGMTVVVHVPSRALSMFVDVHDAHAMFVLGQARSRPGAVGECERQGRRQDAKQIGDRDQPRRHRSVRSGQPRQHWPFRILSAGNAESYKRSPKTFRRQDATPTIEVPPYYLSARPTTAMSSAIFLRWSALSPLEIACSTQWAT
jgi:hypothetical protein